MTTFDIYWSDKHDIWNIIWLPLVFLTNIYLLAVWNQTAETAFVTVFLLYLVLDFIWLLVKPCSVSTPKIMLLHHCVTILGVSFIPYLDNEMKYIICLATLVEFNTWVRLLKKLANNHIYLDITFVVSWFFLRCLIGPYIQLIIAKKCYNEFNTVNATIFAVGLVLNGLSVKWTFDLVAVIRKRYFSNK